MKKQVLRPGMKKPESGRRIGSGPARLLPVFCIILLLAGCGYGTADTAEQTEETLSRGEDETERTEREIVIPDDNYRNYYEIFVASFYDSDGDKTGDLNGVAQKLDYIQDMGFTGIWLMPVMPSPTYHKYDVTDYCGVDEEYGTTEDFRRLAEDCRERNIRLIIDMPINHTSSEHPWFQAACEYLAGLETGEEIDEEACPYAGYYHFSREQENENYHPVPGTEWYYEGVFWSGMPDLNLEKEAVRRELEKAASFWIELGADGFRMDAALHYEENDTAFNTEVLRWMYDYCLQQNPDFYMVSEVWAGEKTIAEYYGSGTPSLFNFDLADAEGKLIKAARGKYSAESLVDAMISYQEDFSARNPEWIDAPFLTNHDMGRTANALISDENDVKMAGGLLLTMGGSPFVYYGEEIGMRSRGTKDENKRLSMYWSDTDETGRTLDPAGADEGIGSAFGSVEEQLSDGTSILNYYRRALRLRNENPEIARGTVGKVEALCKEQYAAVLKTWGDSSIAIVYNISDEEAEIDLKEGGLEEMEIRGSLTLNGEEIGRTQDVICMPGQSVCILK